MRRSEDFALTIRGGVRVGRPSLVVHARRSADRDGTRVGLVVAKAVGGAVVRNRVRRRLRSVVVEHRDTLPGSTDVVVRALPAAADAPYAQLGSELLSALRSADRRIAARAVQP